jgi:hypothetical protein
MSARPDLDFAAIAGQKSNQDSKKDFFVLLAQDIRSKTAAAKRQELTPSPMYRLLHKTKHVYHLARATLWLALAFARAAWYFRYRALAALALPHPEALSSKEKRRLKHYFYGTTYLSVIFCCLRGRTRTRREKQLFTNLAALAYFFDDLVDAYRSHDRSGHIWQDNPETYGATADERGLALHFLHNIYAALPAEDLAEFKAFMHQVFNVETAGRQQHNALTDSDLAQITAQKGGYSVLLFRRVLAHPLRPAERAALHQFGYLIQLSDDIFDLWFDAQDGTATLPASLLARGDIQGLHALYEQVLADTHAAFQHSDFPHAQVATTQRVVHFIASLTRVCLQGYADLQKKHGTLPLQQRQLMVLDMERWPNRIRAARALLRWP